MSHRTDIARSAVVSAMRLRQRHARDADKPICPVDIALDEGIDVRFEAIATLEGMYTPEGPLIVLGSLRPSGRRAYTCAHELGHHMFGHGIRLDEIRADTGSTFKDDAEFLADRFAAALLMPKLAVLSAFAQRKWAIASTTPEQVFTIAGLLGVGYTTLIGYLEGTLGSITSMAASALRRVSPKAIRSRLLELDEPPGVVIVDEMWCGRSVDLTVGDFIVTPRGANVEGDIFDRTNDRLLRARAPGIVSLTDGAWCVNVRVMRADYTGLAVYRHLEEVGSDE